MAPQIVKIPGVELSHICMNLISCVWNVLNVSCACAACSNFESILCACTTHSNFEFKCSNFCPRAHALFQCFKCSKFWRSSHATKGFQLHIHLSRQCPEIHPLLLLIFLCPSESLFYIRFSDHLAVWSSSRRPPKIRSITQCDALQHPISMHG